MNKEIIFTQENGVATLRVNRPAARNALNWTAQEQFAAAVEKIGAEAEASAGVRALIITGTGDKAFVSGGDLKELSQHPEPEAGAQLNRVMGAALTQLTQLPIPVIAAVNGDAFGGGCEILTACDLRLAASHARFCFAQVRNALCTGWGGTGRLVNLLGQARALDLLLTSRVFDAQEAQQLGLVQQVVADEVGLETAVTQLAHTLIKLPQHALAATKQLIHAANRATPTAVNELETNLFVNLWAEPDHLEALTAFREKRKPIFGRK
ncbi:enoyl-CoA hydratase/isomerase family protein [Candidatus Leptofilum sp.]|uniref:enoyl-CoA hydratase/isomerase family protein n=1 Tax=Candidatus Leptofilum sp. TaxID=3241576 RepID=UPI003B58CD65